jgi:hypothetical protein
MEITAEFRQPYGTKGGEYRNGILTIFMGGNAISFGAGSGLPGGQYPDSCRIKGGIIPPSSLLSPDRQYKIIVNPLDSRNVRGVEGNFYPIRPDTMIMRNGLERGYFGVHADAGVLGSLGCIVIRNRANWIQYESTMKTISQTEVREIPLDVFYYS